MKHNSLLSFGALIVLSACTVGPDYSPPDIQAPKQFVSQTVLDALNEQEDNKDFPADWWTGFNDPILDDLVTAGLAGNYDLAAATARVKEAQARVRLAGADDNLGIDGSLDSTLEERKELQGDKERTTSRNIRGGIGLALPFDLFGKTRRSVQSAKAELGAARADLRSIVLEISSEIAGEYLRLRGNQRQLELLRESVALQEKTLSIVKGRYNAGLSPELDWRRAETSVENLRADIPPLEESLQNARNRLAVLTGQFPGAYETLLKDHKSIPEYDAPIPHAMPLDVLKSRPDIYRAEENLKQAIADIGVAEADYYPTFAISGTVAINSSGASSGSTTDFLIASISALIDQVLLDDGSIDASIEIAQAQAQEALADYEQALRNAVNEVETSLAALESSMKRQDSLQKAVSSSQRSFSQAQTLYQEGLISFLDVVDAQRVLASANQALAREKTNYASQISTLFRVLGIEPEFVLSSDG